MSSFTTRLIIEDLDGVNFRIHEPFIYYEGELGSDCWVAVPVDFVTDFASTPRFLWRIVPPTGLYGKAAVVHDYLCKHRKMMRHGVEVTLTRKECDRIFLEAMEVLKVPKWKRHAMYSGVRAYAIVKGIK